MHAVKAISAGMVTGGIVGGGLAAAGIEDGPLIVAFAGGVGALGGSLGGLWSPGSSAAVQGSKSALLLGGGVALGALGAHVAAELIDH